MIHSLRLGLAFAAALSSSTALVAQDAGDQPQDYLVLAGFAAGRPYDDAAVTLANGRGAEIVRFDPADLEPLRKILADAQPRYVALVLPPSRIDFELQRRFLQLATEVDDDPFVDFAFGYITGRSPADAELLVHRSLAREPRVPARYASMDGGSKKSWRGNAPLSLRGEDLPGERFAVAGQEAFPDDGRDAEFVAASLPELTGADVVMFAGHGMPDEVVGGPRGRDLRRLSLADSVVLNVACYTGVTSRYFERRRGLVGFAQKQVASEDSYCLNVLATGVLGYVAYLCPRPAGPELHTDLVDLVVGGSSLGAARRRDYDETVLGFLGYGEQRMELRSVTDGFEARDAVRDMMLEGATGGVLFGDPAVVPFVAAPERLPVSVAFAAEGDATQRVTIHVPSGQRWLHAADQTARMGQIMAMKAHARVPIGQGFVESIDAVVVRVGGQQVDHRLVWAFEQDRGEHFAQVKVMWPRAGQPDGDVEVRLAVRTTADRAAAHARGGDVTLVPGAADAEAISLALQRAAEARGVSAAVLESAWRLNRIETHNEGVTERPELERALRAAGREGFAAVCALIDAGETHHRTCVLFALVNEPGLEAELLKLAAREDLPNYADWTVLRGLGHFDTPEVRQWLLDHLESETGAGRYMSVAQALAKLSERRAAEPIGERILEMRNGWNGVQRYLIDALADIDGPEATAQLEAIAACDDEAAAASAKDALSRR